MALARDSINKITKLNLTLIDTVNFFHCADTSLKVKIFNAVSALATMQYRFSLVQQVEDVVEKRNKIINRLRIFIYLQKI